ncbi:cytochrome P450 3A6-like [Ixodes scapularis]
MVPLSSPSAEPPAKIAVNIFPKFHHKKIRRFMIGIFLSSLLVIAIAMYISWRKRKFSLFRDIGIPGPRPNIISGNLPELVEKGALVTFKEWIEKYGSVVGFYNGRLPMVLINDLDLIKQVQISMFSGCSARGMMTMLSSNHPVRKLHMFNATGRKWKTIRSVCTRAYNSVYIKKMSHLLELCTDEFLEALEATANKGERFDTVSMCRAFAASAMLRTAFSFKMDEQDKTGRDISKCVDKLTLRNIALFDGGLLHWLSNCFPEFTRLIQLALRIAEYIKPPGMCEVLDAIAPIIYTRKLNQSEIRSTDLLQFMVDAAAPNSGCPGPSDPLTTSSRDKTTGDSMEGNAELPSEWLLSDAEILSNASLVLSVGTVNLSKYLCWMLYLLAKHQDVQKKVKAEVQKILVTEGAINYGTVTKMQYLEQALKEGLRMHSSPSGFVTRLAEKDIDTGSVVIPKGVSILIPTYILHKDSELWEDPERFDPERFAPGNNKPVEVDSIAFQPFGAGPRNCFAMMFSKVILMLLLAKVLSEYRLVLNDDHHKLDMTDRDMEDMLAAGYVERARLITFEKH